METITKEMDSRDRVWIWLLVPTFYVTFITCNSSAVEMMKVTVETITMEMDRSDRVWAKLLVQGYSRIKILISNFVHQNLKVRNARLSK